MSAIETGEYCPKCGGPVAEVRSSDLSLRVFRAGRECVGECWDKGRELEDNATPPYEYADGSRGWKPEARS